MALLFYAKIINSDEEINIMVSMIMQGLNYISIPIIQYLISYRLDSNVVYDTDTSMFQV